MRRLFTLLAFIFALACAPSLGQGIVGNGLVQYVFSTPSGTCGQNSQMEILIGTGSVWTCSSGTWTQIGSASGSVTSVGATVNGGSSSGALAITGSPVTSSGTLNFAWTGTNGDVMTFGASNAPTDSGTLLSSLAPKASPTFTGTVTIPSGSALATPTTLVLTNATGLPLSTGVTGQLPIAAVGSAGLSGTAPISISSTGAISITSPLPVANGGTGTASTLTGLMRGNASAMTAAELSGDVTTSGSNATTVVNVNGLIVPASATTVGTNSSRQLVAYTPLTLLMTTGSGTATVAGSTTSFLLPFGGYGLGASELTREVALPVSGTIGNLTVCISTQQSSNNSMVITYRSGTFNGTMNSSALTVTLAASAAIGCYQDTTHTLAYTALQGLSIQAVNNANVTSANITSIAATFQ